MSDLSLSGQKIRKEDVWVCLTDIAKARIISEGGNVRPKDLINKWIKNLKTIDFLNEIESDKNENFKGTHTGAFREKALSDSFTVTPSMWLQETNAQLIRVKKGRYGGTWAHYYIAIHFANWCSPIFYYNMLDDYDKTKAALYQLKSREWTRNKIQGHVEEIGHLLDDLTKLDDELKGLE